MSFCAVQSLDFQGLGRVSQWIFVVFQRELGESGLAASEECEVGIFGGHGRRVLVDEREWFVERQGAGLGLGR